MEYLYILKQALIWVLTAFWCYQFVISLCALVKLKDKPYLVNKNHKFMAIIPAHNEEMVVANLIESLKNQTYDKNLYDIYVIADNCTDKTAEVARKAGAMGKKESDREMLIWTKDEYMRFAEAKMEEPMHYYAFELLYWCGIREGELLALTAGDFDFEKGTVTISKSYQRLHGEDVITTPKTRKSNRTIKMPQFLCEEMQEFFKMQYGLKKKDRVFTVTKSYLHHEMERGAKEAGASSADSCTRRRHGSSLRWFPSASLTIRSKQYQRFPTPKFRSISLCSPDSCHFSFFCCFWIAGSVDGFPSFGPFR